MRRALGLVHRVAGLAMAVFLVLAGLTGSVLAWRDELEAAISPAWSLAQPTASERALDPLVLRERVAALYPAARVDYVPLHREAGRSTTFYLQPRPGGPELPADQVAVDPYSGRVLGERRWGDIGQGTVNLVPFVYRLHYALALEPMGTLLFGIVAVAWTLDCFIGAFLTFPARASSGGARRWLGRWSPAWRVRWRGSAHQLNFDLHRAGGLWLWAVLFVFAWSSVALNLRPVYEPVMRALLPHQPTEKNRPAGAVPQPVPGLSWSQARNTGRALMAEAAARQGFSVQAEDSLAYDPFRAVFRYDVRGSLDIRDHGGMTRVDFDANTGALRRVWLPTGAAGGDTVRTWLTSLHMAALWGWPLKAFVCAMGLAVAGLSVTGVLVWWKKRRARQAAACFSRKAAHRPRP
jgi:uncharacterized iron-regulated membrane protein